MSEFDVIICGAGAAGGVTAKCISDNHKISVLFLEAGSNQNENIYSKFPFRNDTEKIWMESKFRFC